jgi:hypothetical protein
VRNIRRNREQVPLAQTGFLLTYDHEDFTGGHIGDLLVRVRVRRIRLGSRAIVHVDHGDHDIIGVSKVSAPSFTDLNRGYFRSLHCSHVGFPQSLTNGCYDSMIAWIGFDFLF